jgi:hypothetical protein
MTTDIRSALKRLVELDRSSPMVDETWAARHEDAIADAIEALAAEPVGEGPDGFSRRQRGEYAKKLCTEAGIQPKEKAALIKEAEVGMPLQDLVDIINHSNCSVTNLPQALETGGSSDR